MRFQVADGENIPGTSGKTNIPIAITGVVVDGGGVFWFWFVVVIYAVRFADVAGAARNHRRKKTIARQNDDVDDELCWRRLHCYYRDGRFCRMVGGVAWCGVAKASDVDSRRRCSIGIIAGDVWRL